MNTFYRRRLPHIHPEEKWIFLTWSLHRAMPAGRYPPPHKLSAGQAFVWTDRYLDTTRGGPQYLKRPEIAKVVVDSLHEGQILAHYELGPWVIMPNHVHVLLLPRVPVPRLMRAIKGFTARRANQILGLTGTPFWQGESYDHWVRNGAEWEKIANYIEDNPVKAGLVTTPEEYRWSSAQAPA